MIKRLILIAMMGQLLIGSSTLLADRLVIISPHRKSIQREFIPLFVQDYKKRYGKKIRVEWLDQGGTTDSVRFIKAKFANSEKSAGIDLLWGGGELVFNMMAKDGYLANLSTNVRNTIPTEIAGAATVNPSNSWIGTALSTYGIFYNRKLVEVMKLPPPKVWADLARPEYYDHISTADSRRSGSVGAMVEVILHANGWEKGWRILTAIAANTNKFTHSSSDPIKTVVSGNAVASLSIDFYAFSRINKLGADKLAFVIPKKQTVISTDPIAILRGAPNRKEAERFVEFILRADVQQRLFLPKGAENGPIFSYLGRIAVNPESYKNLKSGDYLNPHKFKSSDLVSLNQELAARAIIVRKDLIGAIHVDIHKKLRKAWKAAVDAGDEKLLKELATPPVSEKEFMQLTEKWDDGVFRNKKINAWLDASRVKYRQVLAKATAKTTKDK